jgi:hypothetical protein
MLPNLASLRQRGHPRAAHIARLNSMARIHRIGDEKRTYSSIAVDFHHILLASLPAHSLMLRSAGLLNRLKRSLSRGSSPAGYPAEPLVSYQINRQLSGWIPPPLVIRAFGAHCQQPTSRVGRHCYPIWSTSTGKLSALIWSFTSVQKQST